MARSGVQLSQIVPWGRTLAEYEGMFALSRRDLAKSILGCADGPASFNAEMAARGHQVVSCVPIYVFSARELRLRCDETYATMMGQMPAKLDNFVWDIMPSIEALGELRQTAMETFLRDFARSKRSGRYVASALPHLAFSDKAFDLALCSNFLFLYSEHMSEAFHTAALHELCRVAREVRVFPLLDLNGRLSPRLDPALRSLRRKGLSATVRTVPYEFVKGANEMLVVGKQEIRLARLRLRFLPTKTSSVSVNEEAEVPQLTERKRKSESSRRLVA